MQLVGIVIVIVTSDSDFNEFIVCSYRKTVHRIVYEYLQEVSLNKLPIN